MEQEMRPNPVLATRSTNQRTIERAGAELAAAERRPLPPTVAEQIRAMAPSKSQKKKNPVGVKSEIKNLGPGTLFFS